MSTRIATKVKSTIANLNARMNLYVCLWALCGSNGEHWYLSGEFILGPVSLANAW